MTQAEIAERSGYSQQAISATLNGDRTPSLKMALGLEKATGMCRESWLFPERHRNVYMPFTDARFCLTCPNRINRVKVTSKKMLELARGMDDKVEICEATIEIIKAINDLGGDVTVGIRELEPGGIRLLAVLGDNHAPTFIPNDAMPWGIGKFRKGETVHIPYFPHDLPPEAQTDRMFIEPLQVRCFLAMSSGRFVLLMVSHGPLILWTEEIIKGMEKFIVKLGEILVSKSVVHPDTKSGG